MASSGRLAKRPRTAAGPAAIAATTLLRGSTNPSWNQFKKDMGEEEEEVVVSEVSSLVFYTHSLLSLSLPPPCTLSHCPLLRCMAHSQACAAVRVRVVRVRVRAWGVCTCVCRRRRRQR
jgi:hypothetical protein